ncbi:hypothetical protein ACMD2_20112 [Ananas comosus]|uniref:DDE Tnp4 domain-containing protein n=1 Tax=Ananas comosus TaxID=4615 RepID=A0A199UYH1_ANACO|nr:hypothetical protein ACMD2_20112 [Ananas comosus]
MAKVNRRYNPQTGETISRYFRTVLRAICAIKNQFVQQAGPETHPEIASSPLYLPYFKDCIGLLDDTHIEAKVPVRIATRFRGRKGLTQNVMVAVKPDCRFTYVLAGWEGSANNFTTSQSINAQETEMSIVPLSAPHKEASKKQEISKRKSTSLSEKVVQAKSGLKVDKGFKKTTYIAAASTLVDSCVVEVTSEIESGKERGSLLPRTFEIESGKERGSSLPRTFEIESGEERVNIEARDETIPDDDSIEKRGLRQDGDAFTPTNNNSATPSSGKSRGKKPREANEEHFDDLIATVKEVAVAIKISVTAHWSDNLWPRITETGGHSNEIYDAPYSFLYDDEKKGRKEDKACTDMLALKCYTYRIQLDYVELEVSSTSLLKVHVIS